MLLRGRAGGVALWEGAGAAVAVGAGLAGRIGGALVRGLCRRSLCGLGSMRINLKISLFGSLRSFRCLSANTARGLVSVCLGLVSEYYRHGFS